MINSIFCVWGATYSLANSVVISEPSNSRMVASLDRKRLEADFGGGGDLGPRRFR